MLMPTLRVFDAQRCLAHSRCSVNSSCHHLLFYLDKPWLLSQLHQPASNSAAAGQNLSGWLQYTQEFECNQRLFEELFEVHC